MYLALQKIVGDQYIVERRWVSERKRYGNKAEALERCYPLYSPGALEGVNKVTLFGSKVT